MSSELFSISFRKYIITIQIIHHRIGIEFRIYRKSQAVFQKKLICMKDQRDLLKDPSLEVSRE